MKKMKFENELPFVSGRLCDDIALKISDGDVQRTMSLVKTF